MVQRVERVGQLVVLRRRERWRQRQELKRQEEGERGGRRRGRLSMTFTMVISSEGRGTIRSQIASSFVIGL